MANTMDDSVRFPVLSSALEVRKERTDEQYGDHKDASTALGEMWAGLLSQHYGFHLEPIPGSVVNLMMVVNKVSRAMKEGVRMNDFTDIAGYAEMAYLSKDNEDKEDG